MAKANNLEQGREAFRRGIWSDAYTKLLSADIETQLEPGDLELLAQSAYLTGKITKSTDFLTRTHQTFLNQNNIKRAANCAFWLGMILLIHGKTVQGGGWIARCERLLNDYKQECAERGFLLVPKALQCMRAGHAGKAHELFTEAVNIGNHFNNPDLIILGRLGRGQSLIFKNNIKEGTTLFDEVMVAVLSEQISPIVTGIVYCAVIETCQKIYDLERAREWTDALTHWCDSHTDLVPFRGQCLVRRAEIMQLHGRWQEAMIEIEQACKLLSQPPGEKAAGEAFYRHAELFRLQGNFTEAEKAYRQAHKWGRKPQPGLALLRLGRGETHLAAAAIRQAEEEVKERLGRIRILQAYVEIMLAADDLSAAQTAAEELSEAATELQAPFLRAIADYSQGSFFLASGEPKAAVNKLRSALARLKMIEASYETARTRVLVGLACRKLGDKDTSEMELDIAREIFQQIGAEPDRARVESLVQKNESESSHAHGLTRRELQVLRHLATGKTNSVIASELFISERTVDRHVSNLLSKLNVSSRAAATAYAYEHDLV